MGAWSCTILGSDDALDCLDNIKDLLLNSLPVKIQNEIDKNEDRDTLFYPLTEVQSITCFSEIKKMLDSDNIRGYLMNYEAYDQEVYYQVLASVIMAFGSEISKESKEIFISAGLRDEWASESSERQVYINMYIDAVKNYEANVPLYERTEALFQKMFEAKNKNDESPEHCLKWQPLESL